jgi:hypothetical protein
MYDYGANCIYFCFGSHIDMWIKIHNEQLIWTVKIPDDANVVVIENKIKADKIIIIDIVSIKSDSPYSRCEYMRIYYFNFIKSILEKIKYVFIINVVFFSRHSP